MLCVVLLAVARRRDSQEVVMCRVPLPLVVLEHLHLLLVGLGDARELLDSLIDALQKGVFGGRHEVGSAGKAGQGKARQGQQRGGGKQAGTEAGRQAGAGDTQTHKEAKTKCRRLDHAMPHTR